MVLSVIKWLEDHQLPCIYKKYLGIPCPGCGMQRSIILLLKGDVVGSFFAYPPLGLMILLFVGLILQLILKFQKGGIYLKFLFIFTVVSVIINYIIRFI